MYFIYGEAELAYLRRKDKRLAAVIDRIGPVERTADPDLFSAVVHHIIGQQISMKRAGHRSGSGMQRQRSALSALKRS